MNGTGHSTPAGRERPTGAGTVAAFATADSVLAAPLPAHWRFWQRQKNRIIYVLVRGCFTMLARLPAFLVELFAGGLGRLAPWVAPSERRRALTHLALALPELGAREQRRIMRRMFLHLGRAAAEAVHMERLVTGPRAVSLTPAQRGVFDDALAVGKGVIAVTGHIGNWELLAQVVARAGYPIATIAKPTYDPRLTRFIHDARTRFGLQVIWRGDPGAAKHMLAVLKKGGVLALLIDQDTKVQGDFVPFFARPAYTPTAAAALALRFDAPVIMAWHHRRPHHQHALHVDRLAFAGTGDREADVLALTALMTARLEAAIREQPEQWVWMHRRWRTTPATLIAAAERAGVGSARHP